MADRDEKEWMGASRDGVYALVAEFKTQGPILMETEGRHSSFDATHDRMNEMAQRPDVLRVQVVRLEPVKTWSGNETLLESMKGMQK